MGLMSWLRRKHCRHHEEQAHSPQPGSIVFINAVADGAEGFQQIRRGVVTRVWVQKGGECEYEVIFTDAPCAPPEAFGPEQVSLSFEDALEKARHEMNGVSSLDE